MLLISIGYSHCWTNASPNSLYVGLMRHFVHYKFPSFSLLFCPSIFSITCWYIVLYLLVSIPFSFSSFRRKLFWEFVIVDLLHKNRSFWTTVPTVTSENYFFIQYPYYSHNRFLWSSSFFHVVFQLVAIYWNLQHLCFRTFLQNFHFFFIGVFS